MTMAATKKRKEPHRGVRIRRLRQAKGWSMADLAEKVGLSKQAISQIEVRGGISANNVLPLARALGIDPSEILRR